MEGLRIGIVRLEVDRIEVVRLGVDRIEIDPGPDPVDRIGIDPVDHIGIEIGVARIGIEIGMEVVDPMVERIVPM